VLYAGKLAEVSTCIIIQVSPFFKFGTKPPKGLKLSPYREELAQQMEVAEKVMRQDRDVLRKLAE